MKFKMKVTITDPETPKGMVSELQFDLECHFVHDTNQYGNGHYVSIAGKEMPFGRVVIDLRYDSSFDRNNKKQWLEAWARNYWTGKNGAWAIKSLVITEV